MTKWKKEEIDFLKENYSKVKNLNDISNVLNRSLRGIKHKAARLGISRSRFPLDKQNNRESRTVIDQRYYQKNRNEIYNRKKERIRNLTKELKNLLGGKCKKCGYNTSISALEFHHTTGKKEGIVSRFIKDFSKEKALKEVKKCILLCANCHRELHQGSVVQR